MYVEFSILKNRFLRQWTNGYPDLEEGSIILRFVIFWVWSSNNVSRSKRNVRVKLVLEWDFQHTVSYIQHLSINSKKKVKQFYERDGSSVHIMLARFKTFHTIFLMIFFINWHIYSSSWYENIVTLTFFSNVYFSVIFEFRLKVDGKYFVQSSIWYELRT